MKPERRIIITGASSGIGKSIALEICEKGDILGLHCRKENDSYYKLKEELVKRGCIVRPIFGDLEDMTFTENIISSFCSKFRRIDVLINNAASINYKHFLEADAMDFEALFRVNSIVPFVLCRDSFKKMKTTGGRIINISSISAKFGGSEKSMHYAASKASLESLTKGFSRFGAAYNILVNAIRPGLIDTPLHEKKVKDEMRKRIDLIPLKRMGKSEEVAGLVKYLVGEQGSFLTGQVIEVAGGD